MSTVVGKFVRRLSARDLRHYLAFRHIDVDTIDWQAKDAPLKKSLINLIGGLAQAEQRNVFLDAEAVIELAGDVGDLAMRDATRNRGDVLHAFDTIDSAEGRALWLFINDPDAFKHACWVRRSDQLRDGRSWDGFLEPVGSKFDPSEPNLTALAAACAEVYREHNGLLGSVEVERFDRLSSWRDERAAGSITQITIYTEDRPQSRVVWEDERLGRQVHRPASELHLTYCAADGAIDVVAKGGRSIRKKIVRLFAHHVLGVDIDPKDIAIREIDLSILADRSVLTKNVKAPIAEVELKSVRFLAIDGESPTKALMRRKTSIYDDFKHGRLEMPGYDIDRVELDFTFLPMTGGGRTRHVYATLTPPHGNSVKNEGQFYRPAIEEFLERAGIYRLSREDDDDQIEANG